MRQIVLDTETTGLEWRKGNRVVEIGCVEMIERRLTGRNFHVYLNPQREFEEGAQQVTGLTLEFLADKPLFAEVAQAFVDYIKGAELIIHNAKFDVGFLDNELRGVGPQLGTIAEHAGVLDTLEMARLRWPGQRNSLDALCKRLGVENGHRTLHGALLDAEILADVYLAMTAGQGEIGFDALSVEGPAVEASAGFRAFQAEAGPRPRVQVSAAEAEAHAARLAAIEKKAGHCLWREAATGTGAA
ncbi:DNA polymerase III subunit epsilon [Lysobacter pythonis]|uniref:DNA polymerase III subunit epsilon n=1 Tax=Solilutibacter pythonis TaxID=2483112 RepID=A0A3M2HYG6_9GAMM|nr:DNA polymerase III subunit epsilon [Lysobacter pythonis]RMH94756.1 DNA polymerase III subunit epsilon [Lysobacter pythonis]